MEGQTVKSKKSSQRDSQIKVVATDWHYTEEPSPAFKRLMSLLLQKGNERKREVNDD
ncbi:MAG: hypothetical protein ISS51_03530 [Dehalococcoidales bacterium]|nr:hypothetical protein [Dehalococcoidales bacterium]